MLIIRSRDLNIVVICVVPCRDNSLEVQLYVDISEVRLLHYSTDDPHFKIGHCQVGRQILKLVRLYYRPS